MQTQTNVTKKITADLIARLPEQDQAVLIGGYMDRGLSYQDALDMLSNEGLRIIYGDHQTTRNPIDPDSWEPVENPGEHKAVTTEEDIMSQTDHPPADRVCCFGYKLQPQNKSDHKLLGRDVLPEQLSKAALVHLVNLQQQDLEISKVTTPKVKEPEQQAWSEHELSVFAFWRDINWSQVLQPRQRAWAASVAKHVRFYRAQKYLVNFNGQYFTSLDGDGKAALRRTMRSWIRACHNAGIRAEMKPSGVLVEFPSK